jgi:hypothetical protein
MMAVTADKSEAVAPLGRGVPAMRELGLRLTGAALQILATIAVVQVLAPSVAGIYFRGVVIAYGLAALLRGKYELFISQVFLDPQGSDLISHGRALVRALGIRVLVRSGIACALLLVFTTDLDVMDVYLRPYLQTYLPFVLAVPFATLALFLASALRAVNRSIGSVIVSSYSINVSIIVAASISSGLWPDTPLLTVSWGFFIGCVFAAGTGVLLTRRVFQLPKQSAAWRLDAANWKSVCVSSSRLSLTGIALAALQWGPACVLAVLGSAVEIAHYAVATRTAQIIDFLIPAVVFVPYSARIQSLLCQTMRSARGRLLVDLAVSMATTTVCVLAVAILTPWFVSRFGADYSGLTGLFALLFLSQWVIGSLRPAVRQLAADLNLKRNRRIMFISMTIAIVVSLAGIERYGPIAAAIGVLTGALALNSQALASALRRAAHNETA